MALGLAVNARGADHNRSGAYEADLSGELDRLDGGAAHVAAAIGTEDRAAVMDSMILCKFLRGVFTDPFAEWAALLSVVTGWDVDAAELRATARRIVLAKRAFNAARGRDRRRRHAAGPHAGDAAGAGVRPRRRPSRADRLATMVAGYYAARGLDADGDLGPADAAADLLLDGPVSRERRTARPAELSGGRDHRPTGDDDDSRAGAAGPHSRDRHRHDRRPRR